MAADIRQQAYSNQIPQFVQLVSDIRAKLAAPPPAELAQLLDQIEEIRPKDRPYHIANPNTFYRMSNILYRNANLTMGELSHTLSVPLSTTTRMASWWVDNGYANRLSDTSDRRVVRVTLTDKGRRLHEVIEDQMAQGVQKVMGCLTPKEQDTLLTFMGKVSSALNEDEVQDE